MLKGCPSPPAPAAARRHSSRTHTLAAAVLDRLVAAAAGAGRLRGAGGFQCTVAGLLARPSLPRNGCSPPPIAGVGWLGLRCDGLLLCTASLRAAMAGSMLLQGSTSRRTTCGGMAPTKRPCCASACTTAVRRAVCLKGTTRVEFEGGIEPRPDAAEWVSVQQGDWGAATSYATVFPGTSMQPPTTTSPSPLQASGTAHPLPTGAGAPTPKGPTS